MLAVVHHRVVSEGVPLADVRALAADSDRRLDLLARGQDRGGAAS